jgi:hypothetical protein
VHISYGQIGHRLGAGQQLLPVDAPLPLGADIAKRKRQLEQEDPKWMTKRQLEPPPFNSTLTGIINPFFGCDIRDLVLTYSFNFSMPWTVLAPAFDYLDVPLTINPIKVSHLSQPWVGCCVLTCCVVAPASSAPLDEQQRDAKCHSCTAQRHLACHDTHISLGQ